MPSRQWGKALHLYVLSFLRQMILLLPFSWLFSYLWGVDWIWMRFVVSDVLNLIYVGVMFVRLKRKELDTWGQHKGMLSAQG